MKEILSFFWESTELLLDEAFLCVCTAILEEH